MKEEAGVMKPPKTPNMYMYVFDSCTCISSIYSTCTRSLHYHYFCTHVYMYIYVHVYTTELFFTGADADMSYADNEKDQMTALDTLAAYHVQQARREKSREKRKDLFAQVRVHYRVL